MGSALGGMAVSALGSSALGSMFGGSGDSDGDKKDSALSKVKPVNIPNIASDYMKSPMESAFGNSSLASNLYRSLLNKQ